MDRIKLLKTRLNESNDENWEENLIIQQINDAYFLKITTEAKEKGVDLENQPLHKLYSNNPIQLDKKNLDEQIKNWIGKVNESRTKSGFSYPYDTEEIIIKTKVFVENIFDVLAKKTLIDSEIISEYTFDTSAWTFTEFLCIDRYDDNDVYLKIKMNVEIDSDNDGPVLKRYGKIPEGLTEEEIECEDFEYILPEKINGVHVWYDGFILWSEELVESNTTQILPLKITDKTTIDDINNWLKGDKVHFSWLSDREITKDEFIKIKNYLNMTIEVHPWKIYPKNSQINKLIIGSFPPNKMVLPVGYKMRYLDGVDKINERETIRFNFFYGSEQNSFWELFINSLNLNIKIDDLETLKNWLKQNNWGVTDIVLKTTRKKDSPSDQNLVPKEWNESLIEKVLKENKIKCIYFTSKWVRKHFEKIISPKLYESIKLFTLISPSPSGLRRLPREVLLKLPKYNGESNKDYRLRYYNFILSTI